MKYSCSIRFQFSLGDHETIESDSRALTRSVIPIGAVVMAATGVKGCFWCQSSGQGQFSNLVTAVKILTFCACVLHHSVIKCVRSSGQATKTMVKFFDPGRSCDYSAYRSDHPLYIHTIDSSL